MSNVILRTNATPVYAFLSFINAHQPPGETLRGKKILDCGAGGLVPPVALFHQHGFEAWGLDASDEQLERAKQFCDEQSIQLHLRKGDMRDMPFEDETFDYVYEHYSMCHLGKRDTARAVQEMLRVLKKQGLCFLGVISTDTWPKSVFGQEREAGEFWGDEHGELTRHSMFTDAEADQLVAGCEIVSREKRVMYMRQAAKELTLEAWMELRAEASQDCSRQAWDARYAQRANEFQYTHLYYLVRKLDS